MRPQQDFSCLQAHKATFLALCFSILQFRQKKGHRRKRIQIISSSGPMNDTVAKFHSLSFQHNRPNLT